MVFKTSLFSEFGMMNSETLHLMFISYNFNYTLYQNHLTFTVTFCK